MERWAGQLCSWQVSDEIHRISSENSLGMLLFLFQSQPPRPKLSLGAQHCFLQKMSFVSFPLLSSSSFSTSLLLLGGELKLCAILSPSKLRPKESQTQIRVWVFISETKRPTLSAYFYPSSAFFLLCRSLIWVGLEFIFGYCGCLSTSLEGPGRTSFRYFPIFRWPCWIKSSFSFRILRVF